METVVFPVHNIIVHHRVNYAFFPAETPQLPLENKRHSPLCSEPKSLKAKKTLKVFMVICMEKLIGNKKTNSNPDFLNSGIEEIYSMVKDLRTMKSFSTNVFDRKLKFEVSVEFFEKVKKAYKFLKRNPQKRYIFLSIVFSELKGKHFWKWNPPIPVTNNYLPYYNEHVKALVREGLIDEIREINPETNRLNLMLIPTFLGYLVFFYIHRYNRKMLLRWLFK